MIAKGCMGYTSEDFHFEYVTGLCVEGLSHMDMRNQFHLVRGIVRNAGKDDRPSHFAGDQNRIAPGAAEGSMLRSDFNSSFVLEACENLKILGFEDLEVEGARISLDREFGRELALDPGDLGEIRRNPQPIDDLPPDLNWKFLSFSGHFSVSGCPSG